MTSASDSDGAHPGVPVAVDTLVRHATVVTVDAADTVVRDGAVALSGGVVVAVGPDAALAAAYAPATTVDARGGILMPALVNAHTHLAMTLFRGLADDRDLQEFLDVVFPAEAATLSAETVAAGVELAVAESYRAGCTAALDMYFWPEAALEVAARHGFRLVAGPVLIGFDGPDRLPFAERLARAEAWLAEGRGPAWLMPHSTYTLSPEELQAVAVLADRHGAHVHVHAAENAGEVADVRSRYGRTPIALLADTGLLGPRTTLAHAVVLDDDDLAAIASSGAAVAHCPASNLKLASGFCRAVELLAAGVPLGLGTDGVASSNDLDLFVAMRLTALVQKGRTGDATVMPAAAVLRAATTGGAAAVGLGDVVGSIEPGRRADLVLLDPDSPALSPAPDPVAAIVYSASRGDVRRVWADGRPVVVDGEPTTLDRAAVAARVRALAPG